MKQHIHESNLIEGYDDPAFDKQSEYAWNYLKTLPLDKINHGNICKLQKLITLKQADLRPDERGYYRKVQVYVGNSVPPIHQLVTEMINNWLLDLPNADPKEHHILFEKIHPFVDGNGRTGRMLMWWHEMRIGREPTLILNDTKNSAYGYYDWFRL